ncbi:MAG: hypothetical protein IPK83_13405 [Planctomycetes bacterium]|nr:hypothetical protein [Planctomycetota bacterium]
MVLVLGTTARADVVPTVQFGLTELSGSEADTPVRVPVYLSCPTEQAVTVNYVVGGSATPNSDFVLSNGQVTFDPGNSIIEIAIDVNDDLILESGLPETVVITLSNPVNALLGTKSSFTIRILDNDDPTWPGDIPTPSSVSAVDTVGANLGGNTSGITCQPATESTPQYLWIVKNNPPVLYRLAKPGATWEPSSGWPTAGVTMRYVPGSTVYPGSPDSEGVTKAEWGEASVYVCAERNGSSSSRLSVLRYDTSGVTGATTTINAAQEWVLNHVAGNADSVDEVPSSNGGFEGITWAPDSFLVSSGFRTDGSELYNPNAPQYAGHGSGLFFIAMEDFAKVYVYALKAGGTFVRVAKLNVSSLQKTVSIEFDRDTGTLWVACDSDGGACLSRHAVFRINRNPHSPDYGRFVQRRLYNKPLNLPNSNIEGFAIAPETDCADGVKEVFWVDDSGSPGTTLFRGTIPCGCAALDSDDDGANDCEDECPDDSLKTAGGNCGCHQFDWLITGDIESSGDLDGSDVQSLINAILSVSTDPADLCAADFNGNGMIDIGDVDGVICRLLGG